MTPLWRFIYTWKDGIKIDRKTEVWSVNLNCVGNEPFGVHAVLSFFDQLSNFQLPTMYTEVTGRMQLCGTYVHGRSFLLLRVGSSM